MSAPSSATLRLKRGALAPREGEGCPERVKRVEGQGSLRVSANAGTELPRCVKGRQEHVAHALGQTFATIQHLTDLTLSFGFRKLKRVSRGPEGTVKGRGVLPVLKRTGMATLHFLGVMGDAYYEWYERLKARRSVHKEID